MKTHIPNREEALALLRQYNQNQALIHHALAVEAVYALSGPQVG